MESVTVAGFTGMDLGLSSVMHVPSMEDNILSVRAIANKGCSMS